MIRRILFSTALVAILATRAWPHAFPLRSEPKVGSEISKSPEFIRIWFDSPLEAVFSNLKLFDPEGVEVDTGSGKVVLNDETLLILPIKEIRPGKYRVWWGVVGIDGHRTEGDFTFEIHPPPVSE